MVGLASYDNATKQSWRCWAWNRICERLWAIKRPGARMPKRDSAAFREVAKDATVLYLVGPNDRDRSEAIKRGFRNANLLAVDIDSENVASVRSAGNIAITGDLATVILDWPVDWPLDVIVADLCCGLTESAYDVMRAIIAHRGAPGEVRRLVCAVNLQRGRDSASNNARETFRLHNASCSLCGLNADDAKKHRGAMFCAVYASSVAPHCAVNGVRPTPMDIIGLIDPVLTSYRSSHVVMDSAVMTTISVPVLYEDWPRECTQRRNVRRKLAAMRAVRTKYMQAESAGC